MAKVKGTLEADYHEDYGPMIPGTNSLARGI